MVRVREDRSQGISKCRRRFSERHPMLALIRRGFRLVPLKFHYRSRTHSLCQVRLVTDYCPTWATATVSCRAKLLSVCVLGSRGPRTVRRGEYFPPTEYI